MVTLEASNDAIHFISGKGNSVKIAVSACLLGHTCRYDGKSKPCEAVLALAKQHELVPLCPEVAGGMPIPHAPCEITSEAPLRVADDCGIDHTAEFSLGAKRTLEKIMSEGCDGAVLKAKSPSCGIGRIYDGTFSRKLIEGNGVAARLILDAGIPAYDENHLPW